tara:strand:+ start:1346 stop:1753 length:408 start_codon:yes stop_codon:yes gene_type:complete
MTFEADFYGYLATSSAAASFRALVSSRIYWLEIPQKPTYPFTQINIVTTELESSLSGASGIQTTGIEINIFDPLHTTIVNIRESLRTLLDGKTFTHGSTKFHEVHFDGFDEDFITDEPAGFILSSCDFSATHSNT